MEHNPSWKASGSLSDHETSSILCNTKVYTVLRRMKRRMSSCSISISPLQKQNLRKTFGKTERFCFSLSLIVGWNLYGGGGGDGYGCDKKHHLVWLVSLFTVLRSTRGYKRTSERKVYKCYEIVLSNCSCMQYMNFI